jgi:hypothetical protein
MSHNLVKRSELRSHMYLLRFSFNALITHRMLTFKIKVSYHVHEPDVYEMHTFYSICDNIGR